MKDQGEQAVIGLSHEGFATGGLPDARPLITPLRTTLFVLAAIIGGFALSLILGTPAAHAADGDGLPAPDGGAPDSGALGAATSLVTDTVAPVTTAVGLTATTQAVAATVTSTVAATAEVTARAADTTIATLVPAASPVVQPVLSGLTGALTGVRLLPAPLHAVPSAVADATTGPAIGAASVVAVAADPASGTAAGLLPFAGNNGADDTLPGPVLTSSVGGPAAALGAVFLVLALALLAARRRLDDDALPPSPIFETDTSPA